MGLFKTLFKKKSKDGRYHLGMHKTRDSMSQLQTLLKQHDHIDDDLFDALEEIFIMADIGVDTVVQFIALLREEVKNTKLENPLDLQELIVDKLFEIYLQDEIVNTNLALNENGLTVYLFVGVNGTGKTTTIAKLAHRLKSEGRKVMVAAGDTFRAGAIEQLKTWAERIGVAIYAKAAGSDPASVLYDAIITAKNEGYDFVLCDTAGRLQNKINLMNELSKVKRTIDKALPGAPHETLLVLDATTGQNGMSQAKAFLEATETTGVVLTKLDGTAKGGIVLAIRHQFGIPIKFVGLGEKKEDLVPFDIEDYIYGLFADFFERGV